MHIPEMRGWPPRRFPVYVMAFDETARSSVDDRLHNWLDNRGIII